MIYYIEKLDINEEKSRLAHHLSYFIEVLNADQPGQGKTPRLHRTGDRS